VTGGHGAAVPGGVADDDRFEFAMVVWQPSSDGTDVLDHLNRMGAQGWSVVGLAPRAAVVPMPGMGGQAVPEVVVLLQRRVPDEPPPPRAT
jgi:hypothetical protein